jgi:hypothetical protein
VWLSRGSDLRIVADTLLCGHSRIMAKTLDEINPDPRRASSNPTIKDLPRIRVGRRRDSLPTPLRSLEQALTKSAMACGICWDPAELAWTCPETRNVFCSTCMAEYVLTMARHNQRTSGPRIPCPEQLCEYNLTTEGTPGVFNRA